MPTVKGVKPAGKATIKLASEKVISSYGLEYVVLADNKSQGGLTIRGTSGLPIVGLSHYSFEGESDTTAICKSKEVTQDAKNPLVWYARCSFDNDPSSQADEDEQNQPGAINRPPIESWDAEYGEVVMFEDYSDPPKPIVNPVQHPFDPPPTRRVIYPVLNIQRYQSTFVPATILAYEDHTNLNSFRGAASGHALMAKIAAQQVIEDGTLLWKVTYRIRFSIKGFNFKPLNQGSHYSEGAWGGVETTLRPFMNGGVPYIGNLAENGTKAAFGSPTYSDFVMYPKANFATLSL